MKVVCFWCRRLLGDRTVFTLTASVHTLHMSALVKRGTVPETGTGSGDPGVRSDPSQDVPSLSRTKEVLKAAIKRQVLNVYELHSIDIDNEEADIIATLGCEITAVDVMEV